MKAGEFVLIRIGSDGKLLIENQIISSQSRHSNEGGVEWAKSILPAISPGKFMLVFVVSEFDTVYTSKITGEVRAQ